VSTLITSNGVGDLYRIYAVTKRDGVAFNLAFIDDDFVEPHPSQFDNALHEHAVRIRKSEGQIRVFMAQGTSGIHAMTRS